MSLFLSLAPATFLLCRCAQFIVLRAIASSALADVCLCVYCARRVQDEALIRSNPMFSEEQLAAQLVELQSTRSHFATIFDETLYKDMQEKGYLSSLPSQFALSHFLPFAGVAIAVCRIVRCKRRC